jgi:hypothetical protein
MIPGYYLNLEDRMDRRVHMEELKRTYPFFKGVQRFPAISRENGAIGCGLSHRSALERLDQDLSDPEEIGMILEDDLWLFQKENAEEWMAAFEPIRTSSAWDVIVLTPRGRTVSSDQEMFSHGWRRVEDHQTATGYLFRKRTIPLLIKTFDESVTRMNAGVPLDDCAIDQQWKPLQRQIAFYYYHKIVAGQLPGYSSIENRMVDYNARFLDQTRY